MLKTDVGILKPGDRVTIRGYGPGIVETVFEPSWFDRSTYEEKIELQGADVALDGEKGFTRYFRHDKIERENTL